MGRTAEGRSASVEHSVGTGVPTHPPGPTLSNRVFPPITESILVDNTELSTLEIARRHVTHLDRFKYRKRNSRCQVFSYRKVRTF